MTTSGLNHLTLADFVKAIGWVCEGSPWVAERLWESRPFTSLNHLQEAFTSEIQKASRSERLSLLRAHPDLGTRAKISPASISEQAGAGLDDLTAGEYSRLLGLNRSYHEKFGFPFILAVKGLDPAKVTQTLTERLEATAEAEFRTALEQVDRIVRLRLESALE